MLPTLLILLGHVSLCMFSGKYDYGSAPKMSVCQKYLQELRNGQCNGDSRSNIRYALGYEYWMSSDDYCLIDAAKRSSVEDLRLLIMARYKSGDSILNKNTLIKIAKGGVEKEVLELILNYCHIDSKTIGSVVHYALESGANEHVTNALLEASERIALREEEEAKKAVDVVEEGDNESTSGSTSTTSSSYHSSEASESIDEDELLEGLERAIKETDHSQIVSLMTSFRTMYDETICAISKASQFAIKSGCGMSLKLILSNIPGQIPETIINEAFILALKTQQPDLIQDILMPYSLDADLFHVMIGLVSDGNLESYEMFTQLFPIKCHPMYNKALGKAMVEIITNENEALFDELVKHESTHFKLSDVLIPACQAESTKYLTSILLTQRNLSKSDVNTAFKEATKRGRLDFAKEIIDYSFKSFDNQDNFDEIAGAWEAGQREYALGLLEYEPVQKIFKDAELSFLEKAIGKKDGGLVRRLCACPNIDLKAGDWKGAKMLAAGGYGNTFYNRFVGDSGKCDMTKYKETLSVSIDNAQEVFFKAAFNLCVHPRFNYEQRMEIYSHVLTEMCKAAEAPSRSLALLANVLLHEKWLATSGIPRDGNWNKNEKTDKYLTLHDFMDVYLTFRLMFGMNLMALHMSDGQKSGLSDLQWFKLYIWSIKDLRYVISGKLFQVFLHKISNRHK